MTDNAQKTYRVYELNQVIKDIVEGSCPYPIWVQGELSDFDKNSHRPNIYFQLSEKDKTKNQTLSTVRCVLYDSRKNAIRMRLKEAGIKISGMDGLNVRFRVRFSVSARYGNYLLVIEDIDPAFTLGRLAQNRQEIINWLKDKKLLEKNKAVAFPEVPLNVGLVTSEGEGYHDFVAKLKQSGFAFKIHFYQASVQGPRTEKEITAGLNFFGGMIDQIDALVVTRGGGSSTDLSWFDSRLIAEHVAHFPKPVLTGIGHFTNISIADLAAYRHFATPSATADFLIERVGHFVVKLEDCAEQLYHRSNHAVKMAEQLIEGRSLSIQSGADYVCRQKKTHLDELVLRLPQLTEKCLVKEKERQESFKHQLDLLHPQNIMKRGFSLTQFQGKSLKDARQLQKGDKITTVLLRGKIKSLVEDTN